MLFNHKTVNNIIFHRLGNPMVLNKTLITGVLILCLVVFSQARAQNNSLFSPVIQVNDTVITKFEFDQRVKFLSALKFSGDPNKVAQTQLIEERLKQTEALKLKITASEAEIEDAVKRFSSRLKLSSDDFIAELNILNSRFDTKAIPSANKLNHNKHGSFPCQGVFACLIQIWWRTI